MRCLSLQLKIKTTSVVYDLELERRVTVIRGLSGTGKTLLCDLVRRSVNYQKEIQVMCERRVRVFDEVPATETITQADA